MISFFSRGASNWQVADVDCLAFCLRRAMGSSLAARFIARVIGAGKGTFDRQTGVLIPWPGKLPPPPTRSPADRASEDPSPPHLSTLRAPPRCTIRLAQRL